MSGSEGFGGSDAREYSGVRVGQTHVGRGIFATRAYLPNEWIGEITGPVIDDPDYHSRTCFKLGEGRKLEPDPPFVFVNHSCEPNCRFVVSDDPRTAPVADPGSAGGRAPARRIDLYAADGLPAGTELTIDYAWPIGTAIPCLCGAPSCRGWIVDPGLLDELLRRRGAG